MGGGGRRASCHGNSREDDERSRNKPHRFSSVVVAGLPVAIISIFKRKTTRKKKEKCCPVDICGPGEIDKHIPRGPGR